MNIDPPYNTGKDFVYRDDFHDSLAHYKRITGQVDDEGNRVSTNTEASGRYHTDWLNMMYPRLRLARNLLTDDGVVFISIDDNEVHNLQKICDEVFGEDNFVAKITVIVKTEGRRYGYFAKTHEQVLIYSKNFDLLELNEVEVEGKSFKYQDKMGGYNIQELRNQNARAFNSSNRPNLRYPFYVDLQNKDEYGFSKVYLNKANHLIEVYPITANGFESVWRWGKNEKASKLTHELIARKGTDGVVRIYQKMRKLSEMPKTVFTNKKYISIKGTRELQEMLGLGVFDFPKPLDLIKELVFIGSGSSDIILDFFSGSSTTAHAVMQLNTEDGGTRQFIMVQLPELTDEKDEAYKAGYMNICEIGKERIRRAGEKIKVENEDKEKIANLDIGFKVLKLDTSNIRKWQPDYDDLEQSLLDHISNYVDGRSELDVVYEIMLKYGLDLTYPVDEFVIEKKKVFSIGFGMLMICLDDEITTDVAKGILAKAKYLAPESTRVVFKDNGFKSDSNKTNIKEILKCGGIEEFITL